MSDLRCRKANAPQRLVKLADGQGLYLHVYPNGKKLWRLSCRFDGKQQDLAFGPYPHISLLDARKRREGARDLLRENKDPGAARQRKIEAEAQREETTFAAFAAFANLYLDRLAKIDVGVRSGFVASWYAAPHMIKQDRGLIAFTSSPGSMHYCFGPAYGAHRAGVDKMAFDMGVDFCDAGANVAAVSIWIGSLSTERLLAMIAAMPEKLGHLKGTLESPDFTGHVCWALFDDPNLMSFNGKTLIGAEIGALYGIKDQNGGFPPSVRDGTKASPPVYARYKVK